MLLVGDPTFPAEKSQRRQGGRPIRVSEDGRKQPGAARADRTSQGDRLTSAGYSFD